MMRGALKSGRRRPRRNRKAAAVFANSQKLQTYFQLRGSRRDLGSFDRIARTASRADGIGAIAQNKSGIKALQEFATRLRRYA